LLDYFDNSPVFVLGQRACLHNLYPVANTACVVLVMGLECYGTFQDLFVERVSNVIFYRNNNGLVNLVADNGANPCFSEVSLFHLASSFQELLRVLHRVFLDNRGNSGNVFFDSLNSLRILKLVNGVLEAEVEKLSFQVYKLLGKFFFRQVSDLNSFHYFSLSFASSFLMNLHLIGSLYIASLIASRASSSETPPISNMTVPGFTTATQYSGLPLPEPIRVSAGFSVIGLCGKILIQT